MTLQQFRDILYCTQAEIKEISHVSDDVSDKKIASMQQHVESFHINPILTQDLAMAVKTELLSVTTGGTLSERMSDLLEHIKYAEAWAVYWELLLVTHYKLTKAGIMIPQPDNATAADQAGIAYIRKNVEDIMVGYKGKLKQYLEDNKSTFPEYESDCRGGFYNTNNSAGLIFY